MENGNFGPNYRRGLVLGLTLAEIFMLLLFLLLAIFAYLLQQEEKKWDYIKERFKENNLAFDTPEDVQKSFDTVATAYENLGDIQAASEDPEQFVEDLKAYREVKEILEQMGVNVDDPNALTTRLQEMSNAEVLAKKYDEVCGDVEALEADLNTYHKEGATAEDVIKTCPPTSEQAESREYDEPQTLAEALPVIDRQRNQIDMLTEKLSDKSGGRGLVYPPCWSRNGRIVYSYLVEIHDDGLIVRAGDDRTGMDLSALRVNGPEPQIGTKMSTATFKARTQGMFDWSVKNQCRFFVKISDQTSATNKAGYKEQRDRIEDNFYKLDLN